jgi:hypothetical protein
MNSHSGARPRASRGHHSRFFPSRRRDYLKHRRLIRHLSNVLMIVMLSLFVAGVIVYTSDPTSFSFLRH